MKSILLLLAISMTISACTKNRERTAFISGIVVDYGSGEAIEGAKIHVKDGFDGSGPFTDADFTTDAEAIVYTDEEGFFEVELTGMFNPYLYPSKSNEYWPYDGGINAVTTSAEVYKEGSENKDEVIRLKAMAWMKGLVKFKDEISDSILITEFRDKLSQQTDKHWGRFGNEFDFQGVVAIGNFHFKYKVEYKRDGVWNEIVDSVYIAKGETFRDTIYY